MTEYENDCVGCPPEIGCLGSTCPNRKIPHTYCDKCGDEALIYSLDDDDEQLCEECMIRKLNDLWNNLSRNDKLKMFNVQEVEV